MTGQGTRVAVHEVQRARQNPFITPPGLRGQIINLRWNILAVEVIVSEACRTWGAGVAVH